MLPKQITNYTKLYPFRMTVTAGLLPVLDDKKRAIRQLAVIVRNEWVLMEEP
jgi:hypothetical protein